MASSSNSTSTLNDVEPGVLGFLIVAAMGIALVFLLKSMNKQFRKIGPKPDEELLDLVELAKRPAEDEDEDEGPAPDNVVPGEILADDVEPGPSRSAQAKR